MRMDKENIDPMEDPPGETDNQIAQANGYSAGWFRNFINKLKVLFRIKRSSLKESLDDVLDEHNASGQEIDDDEKELLHNVLTFSELKVGDIMIPRADVISVEYEASVEELREIIAKEAHTRIPVCKKSLDDISGFVHVKDIVIALLQNEPFAIKDIIRQVLFVPPSMKISDLLVSMRSSRVHMAMVVDEYGGTAGLVTMEDLVEEIVGEIRDEHDDEDDVEISELGKGIMDITARTPITDLEEKLGISLREDEDEEDFDTLGGMLFSMLGRVPLVGEVVSHNSGLEFEIADADPMRIKQVIIRKKIS